jgi:hypothetical protein
MLPVENSATVPGGRIARTYLELTDAIARRVVELNDQHLALDEKCALANGHTGKLLAAVPTKHYGPMSLDLHLQVLGLALMGHSGSGSPAGDCCHSRVQAAGCDCGAGTAAEDQRRPRAT